MLMTNLQQLQLSFELRQQRQRQKNLQSRPGPCASSKLSAKQILFVIFSGNFIGIACARTLHYQFYSW